MLRSTFENSWRHPITGEQYGIHSGVQNWLSRLGLKDDQGIALADPEFFNRYGPQGVKDNPQVTLVSNTGHHGQDQAALYLAQQGIQNGKTWFPEMGEVMPPEYAQQAHGDLRDQMEGKKRKAMADRSGIPEIDSLIEEFLKEQQGDWTNDDNTIEMLRHPEVAHGMCDVVSEQFAEFAKTHGFKAYVTHTDVDEMGYTPTGPGGEIGFNENDEMQYGHYPEHTIVTIVLPGTGYGREVYIDFTATQYGYTDHPKVTSKTADLRDPVTEPSWMATDADIQEMNLCPKCGKPDCIHMVNQSPQGMQIHPKWQDNSSPLDSHGA